MQDEINKIQLRVKNIISSDFLPVISKEINVHIDFIKSVESNIEEFQNKVENIKTNEPLLIKETYLYRKKIFQLIKDKYPDKKIESLSSDFKDYLENLDTLISGLDENIKLIQQKERFTAGEEDSFLIKNLKKVKKLSYNASQIPVKTGNILRKLFKKELKPERNWHQNIPFRNVSASHLKNKLSFSLISLIDETSLQISSSSHKIWQIDSELNQTIFDFISNDEKENKTEFNLKNLKEEIDAVINSLNEFKNSLLEKAGEKLNEIFKNYLEVLEKVNTIEISKNKFKKGRLKKEFHKLNETYISNCEQWNNTLFTLYEDWKLDSELHIIQYDALNELTELKQNSNKKNNILISQLNNVSDVLNEIKENLIGFYGSSGELKPLLHKERNKINIKLSSKLIPQTINVLLDQDIPSLVDSIESKIENDIDNISKKRAFIKSDFYGEKIKSSEIEYISPHEILTFDALPNLKKEITKVKSSLLTELQEVQNNILDIDQISDFNLETAITMFKSLERTGEDPLDISIEGITRALNKSDDIKNKLLKINQLINSEITNAVNNFNNNLTELTRTENVLNIKLKIAKAKALQRTAELKSKSYNYVRNLVPIVAAFSKEEYSRLISYYNSLRKRFGLAPIETTISTEISDFLAETQTALRKLPIVYRRLFEIEPLIDDRFFEERKTELLKLNLAYDNWKKGRYAPSVIVGEKGSGATTLINFFIRNNKPDFKIIRADIKKTIYEEQAFFDFMSEILELKSSKDLNKLIEYLNNTISKQIIILENLQQLFLKKIDGFLCLKILFELISKTQKNVFWIVTFSLYSWDYLNKSLTIADYFGYVIKLETLNNEQMINVILKRHKISGYNITFEPSPKELNSKNYKKLSEKEKQEYLKKEYFADLNNFARSNISLALLFWLRSTKEVTNDTIKMGSLKELDFLFLSSLSIEKIFVLHALLIHDGLKEETLSLINSKSLEQNKLLIMLLLDDGVIVKQNDRYKVNPLLYRQIVRLLQAKNIIH